MPNGQRQGIFKKSAQQTPAAEIETWDTSARAGDSETIAPPYSAAVETLISHLPGGAPPTNLTKEERIGMKELRDKPVTILCADKGNATVVLDTSAYEKKANDILKKTAFQKASERPDDPE